MKTIKTLIAASALVSSAALANNSSCVDKILVSADDAPSELGSQNVTMYFDCLASGEEFPEITNIYLMTHAEGLFTLRARECENVSKWEVGFRVGVQEYWGELGSVFNSYYGWNGNNYNNNDDDFFGGSGNYGRSGINGEFKIKWSDVTRNCSESRVIEQFATGLKL